LPPAVLPVFTIAVFSYLHVFLRVGFEKRNQTFVVRAIPTVTGSIPIGVGVIPIVGRSVLIGIELILAVTGSIPIAIGATPTVIGLIPFVVGSMSIATESITTGMRSIPIEVGSSSTVV
jgi:hypothetical protein